MIDPLAVLIASCLLTAGATIKGLLGIGLPMVAIPGLTLVFGLPTALAMVSIPVAAANLWQVWLYRRTEGIWPVLLPFVCAGALGTALGTIILVSVAEVVLELALAAMLVAYIVFRVAQPGWALSGRRARAGALPVGLAAGMLHGATGISGPIGITFFHAQGLQRPQFILASGVMFLCFTLVQIPMLGATGVLGGSEALVGIVGLPAVALGLYLGDRLARRVDPVLFDRLVLLVLGWTAGALLWRAVGALVAG
ncbi:MAG: sulfite exporter TauE/SafE family protein [Vannielia sp.]|uniref:sulfite exporter TauE/SafE family protein n=1 Tax=Rhodobacterales TaxID=204455 RepID=UPI00209404B7|nr:sulfite exporter TauE/SafE family protein [Oceanicola sp. 502str15]MCO6381513.1 TSUP family transporter [Oceanicola sp. 502str15]